MVLLTRKMKAGGSLFFEQMEFEARHLWILMRMHWCSRWRSHSEEKDSPALTAVDRQVQIPHLSHFHHRRHLVMSDRLHSAWGHREEDDVMKGMVIASERMEEATRGSACLELASQEKIPPHYHRHHRGH